ncbi:MAG: Unknown protein [uncultured Thiotrichaceae bacterium]|uniref:Uncharacterized protein n=1 Tax=uncultured Thiotrichaceae bacterium TaxID=298394 RepID=A0A6S6SSZ5_9GAMM|nr:MAG: Unknown protein [uncultured Thiotrichaceae bacterium]
MKWLTALTDIKCGHGGKVLNSPSQDFVSIEGVPVLVATDPESRPIALCPNLNVPAGMKPCTTTLLATQGYSDFVSIAGKPVCIDTLKGLTDGTPPGTIKYTVKNPAQSLVEESS